MAKFDTAGRRRLHVLRRAQSLTQRQLGEFLDLSQPQVSDALAGNSRLGRVAAARAARLPEGAPGAEEPFGLGIPSDWWLLPEEGGPEPAKGGPDPDSAEPVNFPSEPPLPPIAPAAAPPPAGAS